MKYVVFSLLIASLYYLNIEVFRSPFPLLWLIVAPASVYIIIKAAQKLFNL